AARLVRDRSALELARDVQRVRAGSGEVVAGADEATGAVRAHAVAVGVERALAEVAEPGAEPQRRRRVELNRRADEAIRADLAEPERQREVVLDPQSDPERDAGGAGVARRAAGAERDVEREAAMRALADRRRSIRDDVRRRPPRRHGRRGGRR